MKHRLIAGLLLVGSMVMLAWAVASNPPPRPVLTSVTTLNEPTAAAGSESVQPSVVTTEPTTSTTLLSAAQVVVPEDYYSLPVRLQIPSVGIDSSSIYSHGGDQGDILNPIPQQIAWWNNWNRPCEAGGQVLANGDTLTGDALLAAHRNDVFRPIAEQGLQPGAEIFITDNNGKDCMYLVVAHEFESIDQLELANLWGDLKASEPDDLPTLWIVTCDPESVGSNGQSTKNVIYKAVLAE